MKTSSKTIFSLMAVSTVLLVMSPQRWGQFRVQAAPASPDTARPDNQIVAETPAKPDPMGVPPAAPATGGSDGGTAMPTVPDGGNTPPAAPPALPTTPSPMPTSKPVSEAPSATIADIAGNTETLKTLSAALKAAGLEKTLSEKGPFTVFVPTDAAFAALPPGTVDELLKPENKEKLVQLLSYHVVEGKVESTALKSGETPTLLGKPLTVKVEGTQVLVNGATVTQADIPASNGVIHLVDKVLIPSS